MLEDIGDGDVCEEWLRSGHDPKHDVLFGMSADGVVVTKGKKMRSIWLVALTCVSLPPWWRSKKEWVLAGIIFPERPSGKGEPNLKTFAKPLVKMFERLSKSPARLSVYDAHEDCITPCRCDVAFVVGDSPGLATWLNHSIGGYFACLQSCKLKGVAPCGVKSTIVYPGTKCTECCTD